MAKIKDHKLSNLWSLTFSQIRDANALFYKPKAFFTLGT